MKEKLINVFGVPGGIFYTLCACIVYLFPFIMIGSPFWIDLIFFFILQFFPAASVIFWIWGLIAAINGIQDIWAIVYYILFAILFVPFIFGTILDMVKRSNPAKRSPILPLKNDECRRKANLFRETVRNEIISVQDKKLPSCEDIIMAKLDSEIMSHIDEFDEWEDDVDYSKVSISNLYNIAFDMVASGQYHLYTGILKPDGQQLRYICSKCLEKANRNGYITTEEMKQQLRVLQESIQEVG